jgi:negative regulator of replication initiation
MMPTIRIDDDVWRYLQSKARPFEDTPNDVLRRELRIIEANSELVGGPPAKVHADNFTPDKDYTNLRVRGYRLGANYVPCHSFKEILVGLSNGLRSIHQGNFDKLALTLRGKKRAYFSREARDLRSAEQLSGGGLFVETNLNANLIVGICLKLLEKLGLSVETFQIEQ